MRLLLKEFSDKARSHVKGITCISLECLQCYIKSKLSDLDKNIFRNYVRIILIYGTTSQC